MKSTVLKYTLPILAAALCITGCAKENNKENGITENDISVSNEQSDTEETYLIYNYDYTGYEDECTGWDGHVRFVNQDYDNDGLTDRVYREYKEETDCVHYKIEFGNGDVIDMDKDVPTTGFLYIEAADLNGNGQNEMIISFLYGTSTDVRGSGDMAVYEKHGDVYEKAILPFRESDEGYRQMVPIRYDVIAEKSIQVSIEGDGYKTIVPIDQYQWENVSYPQSYDDVVYDTDVWDNFVLENDGKTQLVCKVHLFDKWCNYGLFAVLRYDDGEYVVDRWLRVNDEFENTVVEEEVSENSENTMQNN